MAYRPPITGARDDFRLTDTCAQPADAMLLLICAAGAGGSCLAAGRQHAQLDRLPALRPRAVRAAQGPRHRALQGMHTASDNVTWSKPG